MFNLHKNLSKTESQQIEDNCSKCCNKAVRQKLNKLQVAYHKVRN